MSLFLKMECILQMKAGITLVMAMVHLAISMLINLKKCMYIREKSIKAD